MQNDVDIKDLLYKCDSFHKASNIISNLINTKNNIINHNDIYNRISDPY